MTLISKTNNDWWQIRKNDGAEGFVPANYVKEHEPKIVKKVVQRPVKVPEKVLVKKTIMKKEIVKTKAEKPSTLRRAPSSKREHRDICFILAEIFYPFYRSCDIVSILLS